MEPELDPKVSKTIDDLHSTNFRIAKDRAGPVFLSQETGTMFLLTANLRGYTNNNIKIDINEDGTLISISGDKMVQETVMKGWVMHEEEPEVKGFMKVYKIPRGVVLDEIKADYNDDESTLTIYMPKQKKGITGCEIEEVKDEKQVNEGSLKEEQVSENVNDVIDQEEEITRDESDGGSETNEVISKLKGKIHDEEVMPPWKKLEKDDEEGSLSQESKGKEHTAIKSEGDKQEEIVEEKLEGGCVPKDVAQERETAEGEKDERSIDQHELEERNTDTKCRLFAPCFFIGSALTASLAALLFNFVKRKKH